jgi:SAM-dependent methyltransferase
MPSDKDVIQTEFRRAAKTFAVRTAGRFDHMDVVAFSGSKARDLVVEVGAGTGNFLGLFDSAERRLVAVDLVPAMLSQARGRFPEMELVLADGAALPFASGTVDLAASAQALHHIQRPVPVLQEMRRVVTGDGRVLIVDQVATEKAEEALAMNELDRLRDPSHASCRPPSAFRIMVAAAGLEIEKEEVHESRDHLSKWMSPVEFPSERVAAVGEFVAEHGAETGMDFTRDGDDRIFTRRRIMILARRA